MHLEGAIDQRTTGLETKNVPKLMQQLNNAENCDEDAKCKIASPAGVTGA